MRRMARTHEQRKPRVSPHVVAEVMDEFIQGGKIEPGETPARARTDSYDLSLASTYFVKGYGTFRHQ